MKSMSILRPKVEVYSFQEFFNNENNSIAEADNIIGHIKKNKKMYKRLVFSVALLLAANTVPIFASGSFDGAGMELFRIVVDVAKWVFIAKGGWEIVQNTASGSDISDISGIVAKYGMAYGGIIMLPKIMDILSKALGKIG